VRPAAILATLPPGGPHPGARVAVQFSDDSSSPRPFSGMRGPPSRRAGANASIRPLAAAWLC